MSLDPNLLAALDKPTSGELLIDGVSIAGMKNDALARLRNRDIGIVVQQFNLLPRMSRPRGEPAASKPIRKCEPFKPVPKKGKKVSRKVELRRPGSKWLTFILALNLLALVCCQRTEFSRT